jgi:uncharacterized protein with HEPN domain
MKREWKFFVQDIYDAIQDIKEFVGTMKQREFLRDDKTSVVRPTLLYIKAGTSKVPAKGHKWLSLRLVRNPSERFQTSWNDTS